ncbi:enoyl-CoA hydratase/isomerase family protein [Nocardia rhamnosiphila]|uniref:Enoyl-CoA hydratase/isomerase family protein n=1 Tax=Nocardia rhamnosiphila TaxID=426716 RepID=A0ABV2WYT1_9NOCA
MTDVLIREEKDQVLFLQLNRPEARNTVDTELRGKISQAMNDFARDPALRVAIITGAGDKSFCAGAVLKELAANRVQEPARDYFADFGPDDFIEKPVITAVNGSAGRLQVADARGSRGGSRRHRQDRGRALPARLSERGRLGGTTCLQGGSQASMEGTLTDP